MGIQDVSDSNTTSPNEANDSAAQAAVGALLRDTRHRAGLDISDVARVLRISQKYLEALEDGRNADLPGTPYAIGFVRSYAEHLHLDGEEIVRRYKAEAEGLAGKTDLVFPKPIPDGGVPGAAVLGLGVIVAAIAYGVWYWNSNNDGVDVARVDEVPEHLAVAQETTPQTAPEVAAAAAPEPVAESVAETAPTPEMTPEVVAQEAAPEPAAIEEVVAEAVTETAPAEHMAATAEDVASETAEVVEQAVAEQVAEEPTQAVEIVSETVEAEAEPAVEAVEAVEAAAPEPASAEPAAIEPAAAEPEATREAAPEEVAALSAARENDGPSRITVRAKSNSWIQVRDEIADRLLFTRLLRAGDEYAVPNRSGLRLMTGNAGALELLVDGDAAPAIGEVGEVRRNVELDADKLKNGAAVSE